MNDTNTPDLQATRIYLAVSLTPDGRYSGSNAHQLGTPCMDCAPYFIDPYYRRPVPCRTPRAHAWRDTRNWDDHCSSGCTHTVMAPRARTIEEARARAVEMCEARAALNTPTRN